MFRRTLAALAACLVLPALATAAEPKVDVVATGLKRPWSLAFLPGGGMLVTEKHGVLARISPAGAVERLGGGPQNVFQESDSGLLDVVLDPDFAANRMVYVAYAEGTREANRTVVWKGRLETGGFTGGRVIWRPTFLKKEAGHPGGRMLFLPDGTLLVTVGDGYDYRDEAQNLRSPLGKVVRIDRDGRPARDNPFPVQPFSLPEIYTYGHRNPQGLLRDPRDGTIWLHEHGPKGGDEINRLKPGANFGWPKTTHGIGYDDKVISELKTAPGITDPVVVWVPSIAPSGFALYLGDRFPDWRGDFLVGALVNKSLFRVRVRDGALVEQEELLKGLGARIRDVREGPDGLVYILTDEEEGRLLRLSPQK